MSNRTRSKQPSAPHKPPPPSSVNELTRRNVQAIVKLEEAARNERTFSDRLADKVARFCGSMIFVWTHVIWFGGWIVVNSVPGFPRFDPFPFTFLTLVVSLEAIFLSTFIMISQNEETRLTERRNHLDLQINLLTEQENTKMLIMLAAIAKKVGVEIGDPQEEAVLEQATKPEDLANQIEKAIENTSHIHANKGGEKRETEGA
ncbi:MAG TPA: DUF1003 domain-containing protein [Verrucomicrobiales bacterium]|nr:DUF1003 domain-containing protein [Verrucomicrobiales bacterium]